MKYDIAIIGGGPAGLSAAITASSKGRKVVVFEAHGFSPRLRSVELITDYMGCPDISGNELMDRFIEHARHIGAEIIEEKIVSLKEKAGYFELGTPNSQYGNSCYGYFPFQPAAGRKRIFRPRRKLLRQSRRRRIQR